MADAIKEIHKRYRRNRTSEETDLSREFYLKEINFISYLNEIQLEKYKEIQNLSFNIDRLTDEKAFEHGFYVAYRLLVEMQEGAKEQFRIPDYIPLD